MRELRDVNIQTQRERFRGNIRNIGRAMGYELSKSLSYQSIKIQTPLAGHDQRVISDEVVLITILRAGLPLHEGILDALPTAENGFVSAYRKHKSDGSFDIEVGYVACPDLQDKVLVLNDPMLATGSSFVNAIEGLKPFGTPKAIHLAAVIASEEGVRHLDQTLDDRYTLWVADVDPELNEAKYIVPGLGDAGDLAFGQKLQS